jgi:hypothetical protein
MPCSLVQVRCYFRRTHCHNPQSLLVDYKDGSCTLLRNVGEFLRDYTVSHLKNIVLWNINTVVCSYLLTMVLLSQILLL